MAKASAAEIVSMRKRIAGWAIAVVAILVTAVLVQLCNIIFVHGEEYKKAAAGQQLSDITIPANRGTIYDAEGNVLAQSGTVWTVNLAPAQMKEDQKALVVEKLSEILALDAEEVEKKVNLDSQYAKLKGKVESTDAEKVRTFISDNNIKGVYLTEDTKRFYPQGNLASTVLGFTGTDNQGLSGVEYWYDELLQGVPGRQISAKNALNADMPSQYERVFAATDGNDLVLSIDQDIQYALEKYLSTAVDDYGIQQRICGIIMDVNSGKILAMSTKDDYDPNYPFTIFSESAKLDLNLLKEQNKTDEYSEALSAAQQSQWRNKCVSDLYEPGSVFKMITAAAGLEEKVVTAEEEFYCKGFYQVGSWRYNCHVTSGHGQENFSKAMSNSCNPVFIEIGQRLGAKTFSSYLDAFGFTNGTKTGIDLPGEAGQVGHTSFSIYDLSSNAFGQTIKVSPIQMITACCATINGGYLYTPQIVSKIIKENGSVVEEIQPVVKRQVISATTSKTMRQILKENVESGGGKNAAVSGYSVGGKSGTSQKLDSEDSEARVASFFAFAPADDPKIAILIVADEPTIGYRFGSTISAPLCSKVLADVLPLMGIEPEYTEDQLATLNKSVPSVTNMSVSEAESTLSKKGFKCRIIGSGDSVVRQMPGGYASAPKGSTIILYTESTEAEKVEVPNFSGLTYTQASARAKALGLNIRPQGVVNSSGSVAAGQSEPAKSKVEMGTVIDLQFVDNNLVDYAD